jgi:transcriptional regulator with GAF, ATPase, and Fis domain
MTAARKDLGSKDERSHSPAKKSERGGPSALKPRVGSGSEAQPDRSSTDFEGIIGESATLKRALSDARIVASNDATVLILGETGTGKELIARAIHRMSPRKAAGFIKLNCAALPLGLMESELFGYERGAFTDPTA